METISTSTPEVSNVVVKVTLHNAGTNETSPFTKALIKHDKIFCRGAKSERSQAQPQPEYLSFNKARLRKSG